MTKAVCVIQHCVDVTCTDIHRHCVFYLFCFLLKKYCRVHNEILNKSESVQTFGLEEKRNKHLIYPLC